MSLPSRSLFAHQGLLRTSYRSIFLGARQGVAVGRDTVMVLAEKGLTQADRPFRNGHPTGAPCDVWLADEARWDARWTRNMGWHLPG